MTTKCGSCLSRASPTRIRLISSAALSPAGCTTAAWDRSNSETCKPYHAVPLEGALDGTSTVHYHCAQGSMYSSAGRPKRDVFAQQSVPCALHPDCAQGSMHSPSSQFHTPLTLVGCRATSGGCSIAKPVRSIQVAHSAATYTRARASACGTHVPVPNTAAQHTDSYAPVPTTDAQHVDLSGCTAPGTWATSTCRCPCSTPCSSTRCCRSAPPSSTPCCITVRCTISTTRVAWHGM